MSLRRLLVFMTVVLAACGSSTTATTAPTQVGEVSLVRSGGIAGSLVSVTVGPAGEVQVVLDSESVPTEPVSSNQLAALHDLVSSPEFADLDLTYIPADGFCCDRFSYTVTAEVGGSIIESTTGDGLETPPVLQQVIDLLSGLFS